MSNFTTQLRELLDGYTVVEKGGKPVEEQFGIYLEYDQFPEVISSITKLVEDLIGEDEPEIWLKRSDGVREVEAGILFRNTLRQSLRDKIKESK